MTTGQNKRANRRHDSDSERKTDQRDPFQRDRDRVLYSAAFRRLAGVTQVVHTAEGHLYHNRLTHSLKVAQIARRLAEYLPRYESQYLILQAGNIDPDVVETAALVHDLGHPPFGHIVEDELNIDRANQKPQGTILIFNDNPVLATLTDNAAVVLSTDTARIVGSIAVATANYVTIDSKAIANLNNLQCVVSSPASSGNPGKLYAAWVTTSTPTFAATNDIMLVFSFVQSS